MALTITDFMLTDGWQSTLATGALASINSNHILNLIHQDQPLDAAGLAALASEVATPAHLTLRTHGPLSKEDLAAINGLATACKAKGASFSLDIVIDASANIPAFTLAQENWLTEIVASTQQAAETGTAVRWLIPLIPQLVYKLEGLVSLARAHGAEALPVVASAVQVGMATPPDDLSPNDRLFVWDFATYRLIAEEGPTHSQSRLAYYRDLADAMLAPAKEDKAALAAMALADAGKASEAQSKSEKLKLIAGDVADVLPAGLLGHLQSSLGGMAAAKRTQASSALDPQMPFVLLIGAYGGEHIGDGAILGGVLGRIHQRHGTQRAILMTQRVPHTEHLMPMLDVPVSLEVQEYTLTNIRQALSQVDGVVFAGGPLTDIPKQLVRHLFTASAAKKAGKPFIMEGIGPGHFSRKPSRVTARRLIMLADRVSLRTKDDSVREIVAGRDIEVGQDPAFDYLATRADALTRMPAFEEAQIEELLADTEDRFIVGLNARPIRHLHTPAPPGQDKATYTRQIVGNFEQAFADGLVSFAEQSARKPTFVFFPMNAIQFGMSDLRSAHRIMAHLPPGIDFRIWEADASLDGVVALIRRLDAVVAMRFHATIFALSQNCPVAGIDYVVGKRDKVAAVLSDAGKEDDCTRIDLMTSDWLSKKLIELQARG